MDNLTVLDLVQKTQAASGAAAATSKAVTVPDGESWIINGGYLSHDDGAGAHSLYFTITPLGGTETVCGEPVSTAVNIRTQLYAICNTPHPIQLHSGDIITAYSDAMGAGKILTITLLLLKRRGELP